jgi:hypothetical protein
MGLFLSGAGSFAEEGDDEVGRTNQWVEDEPGTEETINQPYDSRHRKCHSEHFANSALISLLRHTPDPLFGKPTLPYCRLHVKLTIEDARFPLVSPARWGRASAISFPFSLLK